MTTEAKKIIRERRTIRFHGVKAGQEIEHERKWWQVVRLVAQGETITCKKGKDAELKVYVIDDIIPADAWERGLRGVLIKRGSYETILFSGRNALVKIIRTR